MQSLFEVKEMMGQDRYYELNGSMSNPELRHLLPPFSAILFSIVLDWSCGAAISWNTFRTRIDYVQSGWVQFCTIFPGYIPFEFDKT